MSGTFEDFITSIESDRRLGGRIVHIEEIPARKAGVPSSGDMTVSIPSLIDITMPSPPNLPEVPILNSL